MVKKDFSEDMRSSYQS